MLKITKRFPQTPAGFPSQPVIRISVGRECVYITGFSSMEQLAMTEVALVSGDGGITGHVSMRHLDRLGNANHAVAHLPHLHSTFPRAEVSTRLLEALRKADPSSYYLTTTKGA